MIYQLTVSQQNHLFVQIMRSSLIIIQPNNQFQKDFNGVATWSSLQSLSFSKCLKIFSSRSLVFGSALFFNESEIWNLDVKDPPLQKDLGLIINSNLEWNDHIGMNISKEIRVLFMVKRNFPNLLKLTKFSIYESMILPVLFFRSSCWFDYKESLSALERLQEKALTWINGRKPYQINFIECNLYTVTRPPLIILIDLWLLQG